MAEATKRTSLLTEEEISEYRDIFNLVDRDGGGSISNEELGELMSTLGINASNDEIEEMIKEIDEDSNGEIDFEEFVAVMSRRINATYTPGEVKAAFKTFETSAVPPGHVYVNDIVRALTTYGAEKMSEDAARELVSQLEPDSSGMVNFAKYVDMMSV